ncbi:MAG TPA: sigma 54-interacting transcriptional regulator [Candidatus Mailhella excrementigallinarum]|nr:sigma 54-interacting transcriptional regulator [Candidatus Mailhella excrementigallinarum]
MTYQTTAHGNQPPREEDEARLRVVKPELPEGWRKSLTARAAGCGSEDALPPSGLNTVLEANHEVLQAAVPIMKEYEECFMRERGLLALLSPDGVLLHGTGDAALAESAGFRPGTVLPGTVRPEAVSEKGRGEDASARWGCWIEPLRGGKRRIMGFLALLLPRAACHAATPALLHAIAANINNQHHVHDLLSDQSAVLELLTDGVVILDRRGGIKAANAHARRMLDIPGEENTSLGPISDFVRDGAPFMQILGQKRTVMDEEATLRVGNAQKRYILSASFIPEDKGVVCTLAETARMQKFAVRTAGSKAIYRFSDILGESDVIVNAVQLARVAAQSDITTLLLGESGTGKELFAHAIHNGSARKSGPFVVVNCGALPRDLVQSELFGYEAGAFTGAAKNGKPGKFELADGGTIFLDEIGEMPMEAQTNLLRLIQNKEVARVGGTTTKSVDVRIVAATNRNLSEAVARGTFRSDLFYRLSVLVINIPALRSRSSDIAALAAHFLRKYASALNRPITGFAPEALQALRHYSWPGNIRELENIIERAVNVAKSSLIAASDLPDFLSLRQEIPREDQSSPEDAYTGDNLYMQECRAIINTLSRCNGNIRLAAQELGIARSALYGKLTRFGIDYAKFRNRYR